ncbi:MAG: response regulator, partial [Elusimicrobiota bacterium]
MAKILIADDDIEIQELLKFTFENEGYQTIIVGDGEEAVRKTQLENPDLLVLDIMMPKLTGFEVCEKIRQDPAFSLLPIVMLTSLTQVKDRITGIKLGADEYVPKPFEPYELVARVEGLLKRVKTSISASPLTGLPGLVTAENEVKTLLDERKSFGLSYIDIDNFKSYNEKYGFEHGDEFIKIFVGILRQAQIEILGEPGRIYHIGGEDFLMISPQSSCEQIAKRIIELFDTAVLHAYDEDATKRGYIWIVDKVGNELKIPLMSVSIGVAVVDSSQYKHYVQAIEQAKEM